MEGIDSVITIKLSVQGASRDLDLSQFLGNADNLFEDCRFHVNSEISEADHWFVIDGQRPDDSFCLASTVTFLSAEHIWGSGHFSESAAHRAYLDQFDGIYTSQDLYWEKATFAPPFLPWMINANHGPGVVAAHERDISYLASLTELPKPEILSVICSTKTASAGHRLRLRFVEALAAELGDSMHWFGNGVRSMPEKWEAIAPYRFHLALENQSTYGVFSEKLCDSFLGLSMPIYWGAPDVGSYFDPQSFVAINIRDLSGSLEMIRRAIDGEWDQRHASAILDSRDRVLDDYNVYKRIARIARSLSLAGRPRRPISLSAPPKDPTNGQKVAMRLGRRVGVAYG
jgi:hypothetical protein